MQFISNDRLSFCVLVHLDYVFGSWGLESRPGYEETFQGDVLDVCLGDLLLKISRDSSTSGRKVRG